MDSPRAFSRTGPQKGPVLFLVALTLLVVPASGCSMSLNRSHIRDSILGIRIGSSLEEAREKLSRFAESEPDDEAVEEREPGKKEAWMLKRSEFKSVALQTDSSAKIIWVSGFVREGREIPFARLGDLSAAIRSTQSEAIWNVADERGRYRLVAKGQDGRARVVYLLSLDSAPE